MNKYSLEHFALTPPSADEIPKLLPLFYFVTLVALHKKTCWLHLWRSSYKMGVFLPYNALRVVGGTIIFVIPKSLF